MAKIYAPNKKYTGQSAGVSFADGMAETDDSWAIQWFKDKGYEVVEESAEDEPAVEEEREQEEAANLQELKVEELKALAEEKGIEGFEKLKKSELIEALEGGN